MKSDQAKAAAEIKKYLKSKGLKCSVTSSSASMMTAVNIKVHDVPPELFKEMVTYCGQYQYGHFDGMTDMYEYSNKNQHLPQAKYVSVENKHSKELEQEAWEFLKTFSPEAKELPENLKDISSNARIMDEYVYTVIWRFLNGSFFEDLSKKFWAKRTENVEPAPKPLTVVPRSSCDSSQVPVGTHIQEIFHTKRNCSVFIVVLAEKVNREEYLKLLNRAKDLNGWYSRAWGTSPAGFGFLDRDQAEKFIGTTDDPAPSRKKKAPKLALVKPNLSGKLKTLAEKMQGSIDSAFAERVTNTPKRLCQAMSARYEGERLLRTQQVLFSLAVMHDDGTISETFSKFKSKKSVYEQMGSKKSQIPNGYHSYYVCDGEPLGEDPETLALWDLLKGKTSEEKEAEELERKIEGLQFSNIPGFFPTPKNVIRKMVDIADLEKDHTILEPSLGSCAIADYLAALCIEVEGYEVNYTLAEICEAKGFLLETEDFLKVQPVKKYERILMNPPFEKGQDIAHIKHAMKFLSPGGVLVAICAGGPKQENELQHLCTSWEVLPRGSFRESGTGVNSVLLRIDA